MSPYKHSDNSIIL